MKRRTPTPLLLTVCLLLYMHATPTRAFDWPEWPLGRGVLDASAVVATPVGPCDVSTECSELTGTIYSSAFGASFATPNERVPYNAHYLSLATRVFYWSIGTTVCQFSPSSACGLPVTPGELVSEVVKRIPPSITYTGQRAWVSAKSTTKGICFGWVLTVDRDTAAKPLRELGSKTCGPKPADASCTITPTSIDLTIETKPGITSSGSVTGSVSCTRAVDVLLRMPGLTGSNLPLGADAGSPVAAMTINELGATRGAVVHVDGSAAFTVTANVGAITGGGQYKGSTAMVLEYQ